MLTAVGIPCGHETIFSVDAYNKRTYLKKRLLGVDRKLSYTSTHNFYTKEEYADWVDANTIVADSSYMCVPYLDFPEIENIPVLHIVRNPIDVVSSFILDAKYFSNNLPTNHWEDFIYGVLPAMKELENPFQRACYYVCKWNELIEIKSKGRRYLRSKLEDGYTDEVRQFVGGSELKTEISKKTNSWKQRRDNISVSSMDLVSQYYLKEISDRYGYLTKV